MTEEEYFRKNYPDSCYGDRPLSPYWDFFQDGVEFGERQSEKKIEELEETIANLKEQVQSQVEATIELDKENAELKGLKDVATLIRAKDFLKKMYYLYHDPCVTNKDLENRDKLFAETEQFLEEIEND